MTTNKANGWSLLIGAVGGIGGWFIIAAVFGLWSAETRLQEVEALSNNYDLAKILMPLLFLGFVVLIYGWQSVARTLAGDGALVDLARFLLIPGLVISTAGEAVLLAAAADGASVQPMIAIYEGLDLIASFMMFVALGLIAVLALRKNAGTKLQQVFMAILTVGTIVGIVMCLVDYNSDLIMISWLSMLVASVGVGIQSIRDNS
jgi:hypothetical protein